MKNTINWAEVMRDNSDAIEEVIRQAKKETYGTMQGWHVDVEINEKGEAWTTELFSHGSMTMSAWKGETFAVCSIGSWTVDYDLHEAVKWDKEVHEHYLAQKDDEDGEDDLYYFLEKFYPEKLEEYDENEKDAEISEFDPGEYLDIAIRETEWAN